MRAVVCTRYGPPEVLQLKELATLVPKPDEVRIKVHATAATSSDSLIRSFNFRGWMGLVARVFLGVRGPRKAVLGLIVAGEIESAGKEVRTFKPGDMVFGFTGFQFGGYAEYACMSEGGPLALKPSNLSFEEAAAIPYGGLLALPFLRRGRVGSGQRAQVYGASGAVGSSSLQLLKHFGAHVTGVCGSANVGLVTSLGADAAIDYTKDDFTKEDERYDFVFVAVGNRWGPPAEAECRRALSPDGVYVAVDQGRPRPTIEDLRLLKQLADVGELKPVIDRCYRLEDIVEAHRYVDTGRKRGNVVIAMA